MIGTPPRIQSFDDNFDWNDAVIEVDDRSVLESIATLDLDPARLDRIRRENVTNSLRRHDWVHRWQQVLDAVGLPTSETIEARKRDLDHLAARVERHAVIDLREEESVPQARADLRR
jgi:hypothetical protein